MSKYLVSKMRRSIDELKNALLINTCQFAISFAILLVIDKGNMPPMGFPELWLSIGLFLFLTTCLTQVYISVSLTIAFYDFFSYRESNRKFLKIEEFKRVFEKGEIILKPKIDDYTGGSR